MFSDLYEIDLMHKFMSDQGYSFDQAIADHRAGNSTSEVAAMLSEYRKRLTENRDHHKNTETRLAFLLELESSFNGETP